MWDRLFFKITDWLALLALFGFVLAAVSVWISNDSLLKFSFWPLAIGLVGIALSVVADVAVAVINWLRGPPAN